MYLLSYFRTPAEALHYAISADGVRWQALNSNRPVLVGTVGTQNLRDPFVFQSQDGRYHLLATDGWHSSAIVHASSDDLVRWQPQRLVPVMAGVAHVRNCWAPECFWDAEAACYRLIWSSTVAAGERGDAPGHRIWSVTTADWERFSSPALFFDPGYSVIDATVLRLTDRYLMAFKDERGENRPGTANKAIRIAEAPAGDGPWTAISELVTPALTEGPALYRAGDRLLMLYDHFLDGHFGISESQDGRAWQAIAAAPEYPAGVRHAAVLAIDAATAARLQARWPS